MPRTMTLNDIVRIAEAFAGLGGAVQEQFESVAKLQDSGDVALENRLCECNYNAKDKWEQWLKTDVIPVLKATGNEEAAQEFEIFIERCNSLIENGTEIPEGEGEE